MTSFSATTSTSPQRIDSHVSIENQNELNPLFVYFIVIGGGVLYSLYLYSCIRGAQYCYNNYSLAHQVGDAVIDAGHNIQTTFSHAVNSIKENVVGFFKTANDKESEMIDNQSGEESSDDIAIQCI